MAGLTAFGFAAKTFDEIIESIKGRLRSTFGSGVATNEDEIVMQIVDPIAIEIEESWEGTRQVYDGFNPNAAEGITQDNVGAITSTPRLKGSVSTVVVQASGTEGAVIALGFQRSVQDTLDIFATTQKFTLPDSGSQPLEFTMQALEEGPIVCLAGNLNQGSLPSGVTSIVNAVDATPGTLAETDEEYRVNRPQRIASTSSATVIAIRNALIDTNRVPGVTSAKVTENDTNLTNIDGLQPHSIRAIVRGGADQNIWNVLGEEKGAGTFTVGDEIGTFTDPVDGQEFIVRFDRVADIDIYVDVVITEKNTDPGEGDIYPANGDDAIKAAILALTWGVSENVTLPKLQSAVTSVPGIITYTLLFDTSVTPVVDVTIDISDSEQADFDSSRINVSS